MIDMYGNERNIKKNEDLPLARLFPGLRFPPACLTVDDVWCLLKYSANKSNIVEIGTYVGGSAFIMSVGGANVDTIDNFPGGIHEQAKANVEGRKIRIINGNSPQEIPQLRNDMYDMAFIDGDHHYENVKVDFEQLIPKLTPAAHVLFHDYEPRYPDIVRYVDELKGRSDILHIEDTGFISVFMTRGATSCNTRK